MADESMMLLASFVIGNSARTPRPGDNVLAGENVARIAELAIADLVMMIRGVDADMAGIGAGYRARGLAAGHPGRLGRRFLTGHEPGDPDIFLLARIPAGRFQDDPLMGAELAVTGAVRREIPAHDDDSHAWPVIAGASRGRPRHGDGELAGGCDRDAIAGQRSLRPAMDARLTALAVRYPYLDGKDVLDPVAA